MAGNLVGAHPLEIPWIADRRPSWLERDATVHLLGVVVAAAALVRIAWALRYGHALDQDGVEYTRLAENLLAGRGYVGIFNNGPQLNYAPLYPLMIAVVSLVVGSGALAARAINVAFGAALVIPMFWIAHRMYGRRAALAVATLGAFHPTLVAFGGSSYAEGPYLTLLMCAVLWVMKWAADRRVRNAVVAGAFLGLAYLVRPEALLFAGAAGAGGVLAAIQSRDRRSRLLGTLALLVTFAVLALPYVAYLSRATGGLRLEGKGSIVYQWGQKINAGMSYDEAAYGIGDDLSEQGVFMRSNLDVVRSTDFTPVAMARYVVKAIARNVGQVHHAIVDSEAFGSPILFLLIVLGWFGSRWSRPRARLEVILVAAVGTVLLVLFSVQHLFFRFLCPLLGLLLIWAGKGASDAGAWAHSTAMACLVGERGARVSRALTKWGFVGLVLILALKGLPETQQFREALLTERIQAGHWLARAQPGRKWIMDTGVQVGYYAGGDVLYLPYTQSAAVALAYIAKRNPTYIVLHSIAKAALPYTAAWFDDGIPDRRAVLVYDEGTPPDERIKIYKWLGDEPVALAAAALPAIGLRLR